MRVERYARWAEVTPEALADLGEPFVLSCASDMVDDWCRANFLTPVEEPQARIVEQVDRQRFIMLGEVRAAGIPPEERVPRGWRARARAFLAAP